MENNEEKVAGTNLTVVPEYNDTALALLELQTRHKGVVYDVAVPKQMKAAKEARAEVKKYRTDLEKKRVEIKAPALERCRLIDAEAKRITAELLALEEPIDIQIKAEEARVEAERLRVLEEQQRRVDDIKARIQAFRDAPGKVMGRPSAGIESALSKLMDIEVTEEDFAEFFQETRDAHTAAKATLAEMLERQRAAEAEAERVRQQDEENARMREQLAAQQRELDAAREREAQRQRDEEQAERDRVAAAERAERERLDDIRDEIQIILSKGLFLDGLTVTALEQRKSELASKEPHNGSGFGEYFMEAAEAWGEAVANVENALIAAREAEAEQDRQLAAAESQRLENERIAEENRKERERLAELEREQSAKAEAQRLASLTLETAAWAVWEAWRANLPLEKVMADLYGVLGEKDKTAKRQAAPATRKPRTQA